VIKIRITILKTNGKKFLSGDVFKNGFYIVLNLIPKHFGIYLEVIRG